MDRINSRENLLSAYLSCILFILFILSIPVYNLKTKTRWLDRVKHSIKRENVPLQITGRVTGSLPPAAGIAPAPAGSLSPLVWRARLSALVRQYHFSGIEGRKYSSFVEVYLDRPNIYRLPGSSGVLPSVIPVFPALIV